MKKFNESHAMRRTHCRFSNLVLCLMAIVLALGCRGEVPTSVAPSQPDTQTATSGAVSTTVQEPPFERESDFTPLKLEQFESFGTEADSWTTTNDGIACTGKPRGYLYSKESYRDFTLRLEYRFPRPESLKDDAKFKGNTGFLVYINGEHKLWPSCLEVQGKFSQMAAVKENGNASPITSETDEAARQKARKPVGQWNAIEIVSHAGALAVTLNGTPISGSQPGDLTEGSIGIQSEDFPFEVRRMRIRAD